MKNKEKGFTLIEIMITVALIGLIAAFAIPSYSKAIAKAHERDAIIQLSTLHAASQIYKAHSGKYYPTNINDDVDLINDELKINIISNGNSYSYTQTGTGTTFTATADCGTFSVIVRSDSLGPDNPCCEIDNCPSLPKCTT